MKHSKTFKLIIFLGLFFICKMASTENTKVGESSESPCEDPCSGKKINFNFLECQRVVYQMKFQAIADCGSSGVCKNTVNSYFKISVQKLEITGTALLILMSLS
jgi:hypothetical protein